MHWWSTINVFGECQFLKGTCSGHSDSYINLMSVFTSCLVESVGEYLDPYLSAEDRTQSTLVTS